LTNLARVNLRRYLIYMGKIAFLLIHISFFPTAEGACVWRSKGMPHTRVIKN